MSIVQVSIPVSDEEIEKAYHRACDAVASLAQYRQYGSETNHSSWRKPVEKIDPEGENGYAFGGAALQPGATANLKIGSLIVAVDRYFAKAKWYSGDWRKGPDAGLIARLYEVAEDGTLVQRCESSKRTWAQELLGWLVTHRTLPTFKDDRCRRR